MAIEVTYDDQTSKLCPRCHAEVPEARFCDMCGNQLHGSNRLANTLKRIGMTVVYLSLAYSGLELSRLILQYITITYNLPVLPKELISLSSTNPPVFFFGEFAFVMIGVVFAIAMVVLELYRLAGKFWDTIGVK